MFGVLHEFLSLASRTQARKDQQNINDYVRQIQLENFLVSLPSEREARQWRRITLHQNAMLLAKSGKHHARVLDASVSGFRVAGPYELAVGDELDMHAVGYVFPCKVVWREEYGRQLGLALTGVPTQS